MKKIFSLFVAIACCSMVFGQSISVTDGTLADWDNVPSEYLFKTECAPNAMWNGLKSVQVYVDMTYINLLVEVNDEVITDRECAPFHVFINSDNNAATGGFGDLWKTADTDLMLETLIFYGGANYPYNPAVFKWWGANGENGWWWTDPNGELTPENGWGALVPEASLPIGNSQMVEDGKIEIQLDYKLIPFSFDETTFTLGFEIQQIWSSVGVLPNADNDELAEKLRVYVHQQNKKENVTINDIQYKITSNVEPYTAEVVTLSNTDTNITEITIPETIIVDGITYTITSIGDGAFSYCYSLSSITIPNSVTSIGNSALSYCSSLSSITIPNSVESIGNSAFDGCTSLTSITIPNSVTSIGYRAFSGCHSLISLTIPNSVTSIGDWAFSYCDVLTSVTIPNSVTSIGDGVFEACSSLTSITIPESVTSIGDNAFSMCSSLPSITIPNSVTSIGDAAFEACSSLTSITIPESVTSIGNSAFGACSSLASVIIGNSVTSIGNHAFYGCSSLTSITIPNSVTSIGNFAFAYCHSLTSMVVEEGNTTYDSRENCNAIIETATNTLMVGCQNTIIPNSVTSIEEWAFFDCHSLKTIKTEATTPPNLGSDVFPANLRIIYIPNNTLSAYQQAWGNEYSYINNENSLNLHVETPGTLLDLIYNAGIHPVNVAKLTLTGTLNSDDFKCMCATMTSLVEVDLSGITNTSGVNFGHKTNLVRVVLPANLTSIGKDAFAWCSSLVFVTIGNSVTSIGDGAFIGCSFLTSINIPNSVTSIGNSAFSSCSSLTSINIPNSVTSIEDAAFAGCSSLTSITIPNSVTSIGYGTFSGCSSLTSINIPNSVTSIGDWAFSGCHSLISVTIPNSVTSIGEGAFSGCSFTSLSIPNSVTSIGNSAFSWCSFLTSITIPESVTSIGDYAFSGCSSLSSVTIPKSVTSIGEYAFYECSSLTFMVIEEGNTTYDSRDNCNAIVETTTNTLIAGCKNSIIPNTVTSIGDWAFEACFSLDSIVIEEGDTTYDSRNNCNAIVETTTNTLIAGCKNSIIPNSVTSRGSAAFYDYSSPTSVTIPNSVTSIGEGAFFDCNALTSITIPNSVTIIKNLAFKGCSSLTSMTIGNNVTSIGDSIFSKCVSLTEVICRAVEVPELGGGVFYSMPLSEATLYVPAQSLDDYKAADQWKDFGTILPLEDTPSSVENIPSTTTNCQKKIIRDGNLVIIRDGVEYNVMGQQL